MRERALRISEISRRDLIKGLFWSILGGSMTVSGIFMTSKNTIAYPMDRGDIPMSDFNSKMFTRLVGESFNIQQEQRGKLSAELIEVTDHNKDDNVKLEGFSILFRAPLDQPLEQNTYNFHHNRIGTFPLFIVPVGIDEKGRLYEAIFNRLKG